MALIPYVIEQTSRGERSYDIYSKFFFTGYNILSLGNCLQHQSGFDPLFGLRLYLINQIMLDLAVRKAAEFVAENAVEE